MVLIQIILFLELNNKITNKEFPEIVIVANWINELDVLSKGFNVNAEDIKSVLPNRYEKINKEKLNRFQLLAYRLNKTLFKVSLSYLSLNLFLKKLLLIQKSKTGNNLVRDDKDILISIANYKLNLEKIIIVLDSIKSKLIIVRPPINWELYQQHSIDDKYFKWVQKWDTEMKKFIKEFSLKNDLLFIDTQESYKNSKNFNELFCDGVHQRNEGHRIMAQFISTKLVNLE